MHSPITRSAPYVAVCVLGAAIFLALPQSKIHAASIPGVIKIRAEGFAQGDGPRARDAAELDAKRRALLIWLDSLLGEVSEEDFAPILYRVDAYAQSSRIVELKHEDAGTRVIVEVYVREWPLRVDVAALLVPMLSSPPRVVLLIAEQGPGNVVPNFGEEGRAVRALAKSLRARGIEVEDAARLRERYTQRELSTYLRGGLQSIAKFGRENGADVVIAGNMVAVTRVENSTGSTLRARATLQLSVVRSEDATLYDSIATEAEVTCLVAEDGARMAIEDATYKGTDAVAVAAVLAAARPSAKTAEVELRLDNPRDWREVEQVAERLRAFEGVREVDVMRARTGTGIIRFTYSGKMSPLVDDLTRPFPGGRDLETRRVIGREMVFTFVDAPVSRAP